MEGWRGAAQTWKAGEVRPQRSGTLSTYIIAAEIEVLQRRKAGEVWPQRSSTLSTDSVATKIELLQGRKAGEVWLMVVHSGA